MTDRERVLAIVSDAVVLVTLVVWAIVSRSPAVEAGVLAYVGGQVIARATARGASRALYPDHPKKLGGGGAMGGGGTVPPYGAPPVIIEPGASLAPPPGGVVTSSRPPNSGSMPPEDAPPVVYSGLGLLLVGLVPRRWRA